MIEIKLMQDQKKLENSSEANGPVQDASFERNKKFMNKNYIECFKCHKFGHYAYECMDLNKGAATQHVEKREN